MHKICSWVFGFVTLISIVRAQDSSHISLQQPKHWNTYFDFGIGITNHKVRDEATSPLRYSGRIPTAYTSFFKENDKRIWKVYGGFGFGNISKTINGSTYLGTSYNGYAGMSMHVGLKKLSSKNLKVFAGGDFMWNGDFRQNFNFQNASYNYNMTSTFGPSAIAQYSFGWNARDFQIWFIKIKRKQRNFKLNYQLNVPLFYHYLRPDYSVVSHFTDGKAKGFSDAQSKSGFIGDVIKLNSRTEFITYFHNGNAFKISYMWDFVKIKDKFYTVDSNQHYILFSMLFRLNAL